LPAKAATTIYQRPARGARRAMTEEDDIFVSEEECVVCAGLSPIARAAMRAELLEIPSAPRTICEGCGEAFWENLQATFPKTLEERDRRRAEIAAWSEDEEGPTEH
jgi:hypothetical protein